MLGLFSLCDIHTDARLKEVSETNNGDFVAGSTNLENCQIFMRFMHFLKCVRIAIYWWLMTCVLLMSMCEMYGH